MPGRRVNNRGKRRGSKEKGAERNEKPNRPTSPENPSPPRLSANSDKPTRELARLIHGIGSPTPAPCKPDPFQLKTLANQEHEDALVNATNDRGKTWIAREEIRCLLAA